MSRFDECDEVTASATDLCHLKSDERRRQNETGFTKKNLLKVFLASIFAIVTIGYQNSAKNVFAFPAFRR